jgi:hypothetical protein
MKTLSPLLVNDKSGCIDVRLITLNSNPPGTLSEERFPEATRKYSACGYGALWE